VERIRCLSPDLKRLKSAPTVVRQRVGIDFRLLFRLLPDRIQVIDLIPRQDLERKIKTINSRGCT